MAQDILLSILLYLCIFQNPHPTAFSLGHDPLKNIQDNLICHDCGKVYRKLTRDIPGGIPTPKDAKSKYLKNLSDNSPEYPHTPNSYRLNYFLLKGWGARGMPFNVLYSPNVHQQKMMKYVPQKQQERNPGRDQGKNLPLIYNLVLEDEKPLKTKERLLKKHTVPRKYYSLIPQLFVSYGW